MVPALGADHAGAVMRPSPLARPELCQLPAQEGELSALHTLTAAAVAVPDQLGPLEPQGLHLRRQRHACNPHHMTFITDTIILPRFYLPEN